jgi:hypothetical protein
MKGLTQIEAAAPGIKDVLEVVPGDGLFAGWLSHDKAPVRLVTRRDLTDVQRAPNLIFADFSLAGNQKGRFLQANFPFSNPVCTGLVRPRVRRARL